MVEADVAREELEHLGQLQVAAAPQRRVGVAPVARRSASRCPRTGAGRRTATRPPRPRAGRSASAPAGTRATRPASTARRPAPRARRSSRCTLRRMRGRAERETRRGCSDHRVDRPEPEHHERVAKEAVPEPAPPRRRPVLRDGQREDVSDSAPVEVTGRGVMDRVTVSPALERLSRRAAPRRRPARRWRAWMAGTSRERSRGTRCTSGAESPAAGIASASTSRYETSSARYISTESARYGTTRGREVQQAAAQARPRVRSEGLSPEGTLPARPRARRSTDRCHRLARPARAIPSGERRHRRASRSGLRRGSSRAAHAGRRADRKLNKGSQRQPPLRRGDE